MGFAIYLRNDVAKKWIDKIQEGLSDILDKDIICNIDHGDYSTFSVFLVGDNGHKHPLASFSLAQLPGCCGIMVSFHSFVSSKYRNKGIGSFLHKARLGIAKDSEYSAVLCTDVEGNEPEEAILNKNSWKKLTVFKNSRTGNNVAVHYKDITE